MEGWGIGKLKEELERGAARCNPGGRLIDADADGNMAWFLTWRDGNDRWVPMSIFHSLNVGISAFLWLLSHRSTLVASWGRRRRTVVVAEEEEQRCSSSFGTMSSEWASEVASPFCGGAWVWRQVLSVSSSRLPWVWRWSCCGLARAVSSGYKKRGLQLGTMREGKDS
jgi:hypothetical protein